MGFVEVSDLALDLDRWVLGEAAATLQRWQRAELPRVRVSVNVSAAMLTGGALAASVEAVLAETGLDPTLLEIEVLENILIEDPDRAEAELAAVGALGVGISLDDFGTGYASLGYLKRFAFDYLKIDRGFIAGLTTQADDLAIVRATILMAHHLGIRVVAEGVEEDAQIRELAALDCDLLQGYRIGKPMPAADFVALLTGETGQLADGLREALEPRALLVGADDNQLGRIATQLGHLGWRGLRARGVAAARRCLQDESLDLVLCDQSLADGDAGDLLDWLRGHYPAVTRLLLLDHVDSALVLDAVNRGGIFRCLQKPCGKADLAEALQAGYAHRLRKVRAEATGMLVGY
jgi:EAL domain-containing protein (putative c-di-GMP-specific phosphodiesterase class I)/ActR/RegA family two-component response regulator